MSGPALGTVSPSKVHRLRQELDRLGAGDIPHSGRTLRAHLEGTFGLLEGWGCDEDVCVAGLFHSVYGTSSFAPACLSGPSREHLRQMLGERAERLVYLFGACDRPLALLRALAGEPLKNRSSGELLDVTDQELRDLLAIECANLLEQQAEPNGLVTALRSLPMHQRQALLGSAAAKAL